MRHGYLSAMVALHVRFGTSGIDDVPDGRSFIELAKYAKSDSKHLFTSGVGVPGGSPTMPTIPGVPHAVPSSRRAS
jgi:hypothetical protein